MPKTLEKLCYIRFLPLCSYNMNPAESGTIKQDLDNKKHGKNKHIKLVVYTG